MTDLPFQNVANRSNDAVAPLSKKFPATVGHPGSGLSRLAKFIIFVALTFAILIVISSTAIGSRFLSAIGMRANAAEQEAADSANGKSGNLVTAFLSRSPGERGATDANKGKAKAKAPESGNVATAATPKQRALGKVFDAPASKPVATGISQPILAFLPDNIASETNPVLASVLPVLGGGSSIFSPVTGGGIGGGGGFIGGGGGGGGSGPIVNPPPVPAVASAVPEPSTWILLLLGFAAIGASIRRPKMAGAMLAGRVNSCATN